jgi:hypothetical protein
METLLGRMRERVLADEAESRRLQLVEHPRVDVSSPDSQSSTPCSEDLAYLPVNVVVRLL